MNPTVSDSATAMSGTQRPARSQQSMSHPSVHLPTAQLVAPRPTADALTALRLGVLLRDAQQAEQTEATPATATVGTHAPTLRIQSPIGA